MSEVKKCETCPANDDCPHDGRYECGIYQPKSASPIGETVLNGHERIEVAIEYFKSHPCVKIDCEFSYLNAFLKAQDAKTRSGLIKLGWKSPEDVERILRGWQDKALQEVNLVRGTVKTNTRREVAKELKQFKLPVKAFFSQPMQEQWDALIRRLEG
jgi:hypothetical protein